MTTDKTTKWEIEQEIKSVTLMDRDSLLLSTIAAGLRQSNVKHFTNTNLAAKQRRELAAMCN